MLWQCAWGWKFLLASGPKETYFATNRVRVRVLDKKTVRVHSIMFLCAHRHTAHIASEAIGHPLRMNDRRAFKDTRQRVIQLCIKRRAEGTESAYTSANRISDRTHFVVSVVVCCGNVREGGSCH